MEIIQHLSIVDTDVICPACNHKHNEAYYIKKWLASKGLIYIKCKGCGEKLGIVDGIRKMSVWLKKDEEKLQG